MDVRVGSTLGVAVRGVDQLPLGDDVAGRLHQRDTRADDREVCLHPRIDSRCHARRANPSVQIVKARRGQQHHEERHQDPRDDEREEGQGEDVETDVLVKEGVGDVKRLAVGEEEVPLPLTRGVEARDDGHDERDDGVDPSRVGSNDVLKTTDDLVLGLEGEIARAESVGEQEIAPHQGEEDRSEGEPQTDLHPKEGGEHARETDRREPHLIGPQHRQTTQRQKADQHHGDREAHPETSRKTT